MELRKNYTDKIQGRGTYRNRKTYEVYYADQRDGIHNFQLYDTLNNPETPCGIPTLDDCQKDESDFRFDESLNALYTSEGSFSPGKKQTHYPGSSNSSQQVPVAILRSWNKYIAIVSPIVIVVLYCVLLWRSPPVSESITVKSLQFSEDLKKLGRTFNLTTDNLSKIKNGVNIIHDDNSAGSFTILYNSGDKNFKKRIFNDMLKAVANATAKYLRNSNGGFTELEINNLKLSNHEELMKSYDSTLLESGVMLVKDLDNLPTNLAMAFHYFCDEYEPLVKKSAIFFTIDKQKCLFQSNSEPHKWIEKCLTEKWRHMRDDCISPLLARVIDVVVDI